MDRAILIKNLRKIFSELYQVEKRYYKVWLSDVDFGGLYYSGKYILNLKADHQLGSYKSEISAILDLLVNTLDDEQMQYIFNLKIYYKNEFSTSNKDDILIYEDELLSEAA